MREGQPWPQYCTRHELESSVWVTSKRVLSGRPAKSVTKAHAKIPLPLNAQALYIDIFSENVSHPARLSRARPRFGIWQAPVLLVTLCRTGSSLGSADSHTPPCGRLNSIDMQI